MASFEVSVLNFFKILSLSFIDPDSLCVFHETK